MMGLLRSMLAEGRLLAVCYTAGTVSASRLAKERMMAFIGRLHE